MLSNLPDNVTQEDCERYGSMCTDEVTVDEFIESFKDGDGHNYDSAPETVRDMYRSWCEDDHYPLSPCNKDDFEELWDKFVESLVNPVTAGVAA